MADVPDELEQLKAAKFDTDAIVDVFEHLAKDDKPWKQIVADHGLDPKAVIRALGAIGFADKGGVTTALRALVLGLRFGQMRLEPFEWKPADDCQCFLCVVRRQAEAEAEGGGE